MKVLIFVLNLIDAVNDWIGRILAFGIFIMFTLVLIEVVRRYLFNAPSVWGNELTQLIFGVYVTLSGGHILRWNGHVNVDLFYARLSYKWKAGLDIFTSLIFFLFCGMLFVYGGSLALESLAIWEHSGSSWNPPIYPFKLAIPLAALLLILQGAAKLIRDIMILISGKTEASPKAPEREAL